MEPAQALFGMLHSSNPTSIAGKLRLPAALTAAAAAHQLQCMGLMPLLDARLAELGPNSITCADALAIYKQAQELQLPAFRAACVSFIAKHADDKTLVLSDLHGALPLAHEVAKAQLASASSELDETEEALGDVMCKLLDVRGHLQTCLEITKEDLSVDDGFCHVRLQGVMHKVQEMISCTEVAGL